MHRRQQGGLSQLNQLSQAVRALRVRVDPGLRAAAGLGVCMLLVATVCLLWVWSGSPDRVTLRAGTAASVPSHANTSPTSAVPSPTGSPTSVTGSVAAGARVVIDVAGKVRRPGVYRLPVGSRVDDAVRAAGGALPGISLDGVNLAAVLTDGQQVAVGVPAVVGAPVGSGAGAGGAGGGAATGSAAGGPSAAPVDLNTATAEQLQTLPGIGPVLAQNVLDYRAAHGSFASVAQLNDVPGIGPTKFAALRSRVTT
jgi:competence protein ComEA